MSSMLTTLNDDVKTAYKNLNKVRSGSAALILKVDKETESQVVVDELLKETTLEDIASDLPACEPRFILYLCDFETHDGYGVGGRATRPLSLIYYLPTSTPPKHKMSYASSLQMVTQTFSLNKIVVDSAHKLNQAWLETELGKPKR